MTIVTSEQAQWMLNLMRQSQFATGGDFSHHKGELDLGPVDMKMFAEVMDFAVLRVGYGAQDGTVHIDRRFLQNYEIMSKFDIPLLGYWYLSSHSDYRRQADAYIDAVAGNGIVLYGHVSDHESEYNELGAPMARKHMNMLRVFKDVFPAARAMTYCSPDSYRDNIRKYEPEVDMFDYWAAHWPWKNWTNWHQWDAQTKQEFQDFWTNAILNPDNLVGEYPRMYGIRNGQWDIWQMIAASGIGHEFGFQSDELDFNISYMPKEQFLKWLMYKVDEENNPPPVEPPIDIPGDGDDDEDEDDDTVFGPFEQLIQRLDDLIMTQQGQLIVLDKLANNIATQNIILTHALLEEGTDDDDDDGINNPPDGGDDDDGETTPEYGWENWWTRERETWPTHVDGQRVGYVYVVPGTPLQELNVKDMTFQPYESVALRGSEDTKGKRIIVNQANPPLMVYAGGNQYRNVPDRDIRPYNSWVVNPADGRTRFDGGNFAYPVMREQIKDGIRLWEGLPEDKQEFKVLFIPARYVHIIYNPVTGKETVWKHE